MTSAAFVHDALLPRAPGGTAPGAALALLVHAGLLLALTVGVDWKTSPPEVISAELWAAVPQAAAPLPLPIPAPTPAVAAPLPTVKPAPSPAPTSPPPAPPAIDAQIATERAAKLKAAEAALLREQQRVQAAEREAELKEKRKKLQAAAEKTAREDDAAKAEKVRLATLAEQKKQDDAARESKADEARLAQQREANLQRMMGQAAGAGNSVSTGQAAQDAAPSAAYSARLVTLIRSNTVFTGSVAANAAAEVEVRAAAGGTIIARRLLKSSGNKEWDDAVLRALDRTAVLPRDTDGRVPPTLIISFRPRE